MSKFPLMARITLPIASAILIGCWWGSIVAKEDRAISEREFAVACLSLAIAYNPVLIHEAVKAALRKID